MDETKQTAETGSEEGGDQRQQQIVDMGSSTIRTERGTIHTLTIVGQIEGHQVLPSSAKTTKYEHVMPLLAAIEESDEVDGPYVPMATTSIELEWINDDGIKSVPEWIARFREQLSVT